MAVRKKILKLAKKIAGSSALLVKWDERAPEYYVLACCVSDEQAEVGLAMKLRKPQTIEQLAARCGKSIEDTKRLAMELAVIGGCIFYSENGVDLFELTVFVPGVMEKIVSNKELCEKHPEIPKAFEEYARLRGATLSTNLPMGIGPMRVLPIESAISADTRVASYEEVSKILDKNTLFAVAACSCRRSRRLLEEGCGHLEEDMCIHLGIGAEYYLRTGKARAVTKEEAYEIIKKAEENGLMHNIPNIDGAEHTHAICNCCSCSCYALRNATYFNAPDMVRSNYIAEVDKDKCVACGQCVENCPTNTLKLGQKICSKTPIEEKKSLSPRDHIWGAKNWNPEYRTNRENVVATGTSPCKTECPAHIAVQGYIKLASMGKYTDALELIKKENPFPAVCGRICPRKCESECTRGDIDEPVAVDEIKKFIADQELKKELRYVPKKRNEYGKKIAVIGAGPAGLACAYYLGIDGYKVTVFEKQSKLGGMLTLGIPSFRLEKDVVRAEIEILKELGVEFKTGVEVGKDITLSELRKQGYKAFYVAIGAQGGRKLGLEGEDTLGVITGVDFLRDTNLGHDTKLSGKVLVIGGGNVAIDVARAAIRTNAASVDMYCLESRNEMPALDEEVHEALEEKIAINNSWGPKRILAQNGKLVGIEFRKCISVFDEYNKFNPKYNENELITIEADHIILSVGQSIEWGNLLKECNVELNRNNTAVADAFSYQTGEPDIFVGGDAYTGPQFAIDAIAAGKQGAVSIHRFVWEGQSLVIGRDRRAYHAFDKENIVVEGYDTVGRQQAGHKHESKISFMDNRVTFTEEQMKKETERCLSCGAVSIDQEICIGCGQCTTNCKFDAIKLVKRFDKKGSTFEKLPLHIGKQLGSRAVNITLRKVKDVGKRGN